MVPLVEVVGGEKTGSAAIERALAFYTAIGKQPIHIRRDRFLVDLRALRAGPKSLTAAEL